MQIITAGRRCSVSDLSTTAYYPYDQVVYYYLTQEWCSIFIQTYLYNIYLHAPSASRSYLGDLEHTCGPTRCNPFLRNQGIKLSAASISVISKATTSQFASIFKSKDP
ncbi:uncharacterized protein TrAtP1_011155 [Trichoderma atroviride]|uniref:uncharacterized protein n=1 Tax=Hypocrea atroviridis TaxID=63577 RepID=UPI00332244BE|nr:hypothetical protein TrAtP1_011155 [Trichoderma atroviride]